MTFAILLRRLRKGFPSTKAFAKALAVEPSHLSRAMSWKNDGPSFDVRGCLKLAMATGEDAGVVLRAAGKGDIADMLEVLYGPPAEMTLTPLQQLAISAIDDVPPHLAAQFAALACAVAHRAIPDWLHQLLPQ